MKDTITCPSCNAENPKNRLTCQVCHDPLVVSKWKGGEKPKKVKEETERGTKVESKVDPKTPSPPPSSKIKPIGLITEDFFPPDPITEKQSPKDTDLVIVPKAILTRIPKEAKVLTKRKARRKSHTPIESQYFMLQNGTLIPVQIIQTVRMLKKKAISVQAQALMSLWNRNKGLLAK